MNGLITATSLLNYFIWLCSFAFIIFKYIWFIFQKKLYKLRFKCLKRHAASFLFPYYISHLTYREESTFFESRLRWTESLKFRIIIKRRSYLLKFFFPSYIFPQIGIYLLNSDVFLKHMLILMNFCDIDFDFIHSFTNKSIKNFIIICFYSIFAFFIDAKKSCLKVSSFTGKLIHLSAFGEFYCISYKCR